MRYMQGNIQNKSGFEMKEAAAIYLVVTYFNPDTKILPSIRKCNESRSSTKRKNIGVDSATIGSMKHCDF